MHNCTGILVRLWMLGTMIASVCWCLISLGLYEFLTWFAFFTTGTCWMLQQVPFFQLPKLSQPVPYLGPWWVSPSPFRKEERWINVRIGRWQNGVWYEYHISPVVYDEYIVMEYGVRLVAKIVKMGFYFVYIVILHRCI